MSRSKNPSRIFISCGQGEVSGERDIAKQISKRLSEIGFDVCVATQEQTLRGIKENIFSKLEESEYLIFIDFKRERLVDSGYRGSLFSHQELAHSCIFRQGDPGLSGRRHQTSLYFIRKVIGSYLEILRTSTTNIDTLAELIERSPNGG
jgi:hypothetical protein